MTATTLRVHEPKTRTTTTCLPCSRCGHEVRTVSLYLKAEADRKVTKGFYSDLSIRLCEQCLEAAIVALRRRR